MERLFFSDGSSLPGNYMIDLETSTKVSNVISSCTSELISVDLQ